MFIANSAANVISTPRIQAGPIMTKNARFWDRMAAKYARKPIADEAAYERKLSVTREYLTPDSMVLEIGCGTGGTAILHAPYVRQIRATDISGEMLSIARDKAAVAGVANVTFEQSAAEDITAAEQSLDAVLALSILHLLKDPAAAIVNAHRWLKPGGVLVSSTACLADMNPVFRIILPVGRVFGAIPYVNFFSEDDLKAMLRSAGFLIDHEWRPAKDKAAFIIAKKPK